MLWGSFGFVHILSMSISAGMIVGLYFLLRNLPQKWQVWVLFALSFSGIGAVVYNLLVWDSPLEYLPLHLCSLNALLLPIAVITRNKVLNNLLLLWALGAVLAIVLNMGQAHFEVFSWTFFFYWLPHTMEFGIPILIFLLKIVKKELKYALYTLGITFAALVVIHFANLLINEYCKDNKIVDAWGELIQVNYMYTLSPENPLLQVFWKMIPYRFWYMMPCVPMAVVYLGVVYLPEILRLCKARRANAPLDAENDEAVVAECVRLEKEWNAKICMARDGNVDKSKVKTGAVVLKKPKEKVLKGKNRKRAV